MGFVLDLAGAGRDFANISTYEGVKIGLVVDVGHDVAEAAVRFIIVTISRQRGDGEAVSEKQFLVEGGEFLQLQGKPGVALAAFFGE